MNKPNSKKPQSGPKTNRGQVGSDANVESEDDSVIGKMFWRSLGIFALAGAVAIPIYIATRPATVKGPEVKTEVTKPTVRQKESTDIPDIPFTDITAASGIKFSHFDGKRGERLLPETMGGGGGFWDYDNDGDQDILFVNSCDWSWSSPADGPKPTMVLYQNDGAGNYSDVTAGSGLDVTFYGMGPAFGDFDNDGWVDVFITAVGKNHLFRNKQGKFEDVTDAMGVGGVAEQWSCPSAWVDYDHDGKLDLIVGNYVTWSRETDLGIASTLVGLERAYGQPTNFSGSHMHLYHNDGGKFSDVSEKAGIRIENPATKVPIAKALGIGIVDVNHDNWPDICVANDTVQNFLFVNNKDGTFTENGIAAGVALSRDGIATGAMGIDCAFMRNDDSCAIAIGNFANEQSSLYLSEGLKPVFTDVASTTGFGPQTKIRLTFGVFFGDMDLDGRQDIVCANGHLEPEIQKVQPTQQFEQPAQLFWNSGRQLMLLDAKKTGEAFQKPMVGRAATYADIDNDGDLDILLVANGGPARLLRNDQKLGNNWLRVKLKDKANTGAIGSTIVIQLDDKQKLTRCVNPTRSYISQAELTATFGLGKVTPKEMIVTWPDGTKQTVAIEKVNTTIEIEQAK